MKWIREEMDASDYYSVPGIPIYIIWNRKRYSKYNDIPYNLYTINQSDNYRDKWVGGAGDLATAKKMAERLAVEGC